MPVPILFGMLVTISDKKSGVDNSSDGEYDYYEPEVVSASDYYPFGMQMPGRVSETGKYRYGFNGYENDNEVKGESNSIDFGSRIYDPRIVKWLSLDPLQKKYPGESHYSFVSGNPILYKDADGKDKIVTITIIQKDGTMTQIQKVDKNFFVYHADRKYYGGYYYTKSDLKQSLIIDLRNVSQENISQNPESIVQFKEEEVNIQDIFWWDYSVFSDWFKTGDNSNKVAYGYRIYGRGHDMEWQSGLPTAAPGTESVDLEDWFGLAGSISPNEGAYDMLKKVINKLGGIKGSDMKQLELAVDYITQKTDALANFVSKAAALADKLKEASKDLPKGIAICPTCENQQDSTHIDDINGKGTFEKLKGTGQTGSTGKKEQEKKNNP